MMLTAANYITESRNVDFGSLPAKFKNIHDTLLEGAEGGPKWELFLSDSEVRNMVDGYLVAINNVLAEQSPAPAKRQSDQARLASGRRVKKTLRKTDMLSSSRAQSATKAGGKRMAGRQRTAPVSASGDGPVLTVANYITESRNVNFGALPAKFKNIHETLLEGAEGGSQWELFLSDGEVRQMVDGYLAALNQAIQSQPRQTPQPPKRTREEVVSSLEKRRSDKRKSAVLTAKTKKRAMSKTDVGVKRRTVKANPDSVADTQKADLVLVLTPTADKPTSTPKAKRSSAADPEKLRPSAPRTKESTAKPKTKVKEVQSAPAAKTKSTKAELKPVRAKAETKESSVKQPRPTANKVKSSTPASSTPKDSTEKPKLTKAQKQEALRDGVDTAKKASIKDLSAAQVIIIGRRINEKRYKMEINGVMYDVREDFDTPVTNKQRLAPTGENLVKWAAKPGRYDLIGVDAAGRVDVTVFKKRDKDKVPKSMTRKPRIRKMKAASDRQKRTSKKA